MENLMKKIKKGGFSLLELSVTMLLIIVLIQTAIHYYRNYQENLDIQLAKHKISKTFRLYSLKSFYYEREYYFLISDLEKSILIKNDVFHLEEKIVLPSRLSYHLTSSSVQNLSYGHFTKHGNISPSFSIYIFDSSKDARYKITFSSFQQTRIVRIRHYKKISNKKFLKENIEEYHRRTNEDRVLFFQDWREE